MQCQFNRISDQYCECAVCGFKAKSKADPSKIRRNCTGKDGERTEGWTLLKKATEFTKSAIVYVKDGCKNSDEAEQKRRLEICHSCPEFNGARNSCNKCGCSLALKSRVLSAHCPIDKW